jgi:hypothetical protein
MHLVRPLRSPQGPRRAIGGGRSEGDLAQGGGAHGHVPCDALAAGGDGQHALLR